MEKSIGFSGISCGCSSGNKFVPFVRSFLQFKIIKVNTFPARNSGSEAVFLC